MRYLVTAPDSAPFTTNWFTPENDFTLNIGMVVYDLVKWEYYNDAGQWKPINTDHL